MEEPHLTLLVLLSRAAYSPKQASMCSISMKSCSTPMLESSREGNWNLLYRVLICSRHSGTSTIDLHDDLRVNIPTLTIKEMNGIKVEAEFKKLEFPANRRALRDIVRPRTSRDRNGKTLWYNNRWRGHSSCECPGAHQEYWGKWFTIYSDLLSTISEKNHHEGSTRSSI